MSEDSKDRSLNFNVLEHFLRSILLNVKQLGKNVDSSLSRDLNGTSDLEALVLLRSLFAVIYRLQAAEGILALDLLIDVLYNFT